MSKQLSFSKYERQILPALRDNLNKAESTEDIKKFFSYAIKTLLQQIFAEEAIEIDYDDIVFEPDKAPFYTINEGLASMAVFTAIWSSSDLASLLANLAQAAKNRYTRLEKHFDKTEAKIRRELR